MDPLRAEVTGDDAASEAARRLRPVVVDAVAAATGPELLTGLLAVMARQDLSAREWVEVCVGWQRLISYATAGQLAAVAELDRALPTDPALRRGRAGVPAGRRAADELAPALRVAPGTASALVNRARVLDGELPEAADALADGAMTPAQLGVLLEACVGQPPHVARRLQTEAVRRAARRTPRQLRADLSVIAQQADPDAAARAGEAGRAARDVALRPSPLPGCSRLVMDMPQLEATAAWLAVNGAATRAKARGVRGDGTPETRTLGQLRADAAAALLTGRADEADPSLVPAPEILAALAEVQVVVDADTLAGAGTVPGHIPGTGPVDAAHIREIASKAPWRRLLADPGTGALRSVGTTTYPPEQGNHRGDGGADRLRRLLSAPAEPPPPAGAGYRPGDRLRRHVQTRDATCIGPACHHSARGTQLDHTLEYDPARGHFTTDTNLGSPCQRVHNAKTHGGWTLQQPQPGTFVWTSPTGRVYRRRARPLVPGRRDRRGSDTGDDEPASSA